ncbi:hypothetical protein TYRP_020561 [Tyrophagus putrescentiae]|nr:hypothetical protein TYRP_020561 [Tyrophagus putrescentiae]
MGVSLQPIDKPPTADVGAGQIEVSKVEEDLHAGGQHQPHLLGHRVDALLIALEEASVAV